MVPLLIMHRRDLLVCKVRFRMAEGGVARGTLPEAMMFIAYGRGDPEAWVGTSEEAAWAGRGRARRHVLFDRCRGLRVARSYAQDFDP